MKKTLSGELYDVVRDEQYDSLPEARKKVGELNNLANHQSNYPMRWWWWTEKDESGKFRIYGEYYNVNDI